ncbi:MAG: AMP-binding protein [Magnetococcales bacterium]|nr:AMP-binding protein [Magnetococcales bacterium]
MSKVSHLPFDQAKMADGHDDGLGLMVDKKGSKRRVQDFFPGLTQTSYTVFSVVGVDGEIQAVSSGELWGQISAWSQLLARHPDPIIPIFGRQTPAMMAAWLGCLLSGKLPSFIAHPSRKITPEAYGVRLANYQHHFKNRIFVGEVPDRNVAAQVLTPEDLNGVQQVEGEFDPAILPDRDAPLFLQCSSGTTGLQKAVAITTRHLEAQLAAYSQAIELTPRDHIVTWLPLYHDMGLVAAFLLPLLTRTPVTFIDPFEWAANPGLLLQTLERQKGSLCWLPNFAFAFMARVKENFDLATVRSFINCSEPVSLDGFQRFSKQHGVEAGQLSVCYALAENVFAATQTKIGQAPGALVLDQKALQRHQVRILGRVGVGGFGDHSAGGPLAEPSAESLGQSTDHSPEEADLGTRVVSCGGVIDGVSVRIDRQPGEEVGEVMLAGESQVENYYGQDPPRLDGWFPTGDLGFVHEGELYLCGRIKDLIIHNGKNLYPQDLERAVENHPEVHEGRVMAMGWEDQDLGSERVLVLYEPKRFMPLAKKNSVSHTLQEMINTLFDIHSHMVAVPRKWLQKTSSGKMTRRANLDRFLAVKGQRLYVVGDSHVRIFWTGKTSHRNRFKNIEAHWVGLMWGENWQRALPFFLSLVEKMGPRDVLVIEAGEPECRSIFPAAQEPEKRINQAVEQYQAFFQAIRKIWRGRLAYLTGIPTHPLNINNKDPQWPIRGTPEERYRYQKIFYQKMHALCQNMMIHYVDVVTPLLGKDGLMDPRLLVDMAHLQPKYLDLYLLQFESGFGYIDTRPADPSPAEAVWDGTEQHFKELVLARVRELNPLISQPDPDRLVSKGVLDSLGIVELIAMLDKTFQCDIRLHQVQRDHFESISGLYQRYVLKNSSG